MPKNNKKSLVSRIAWKVRKRMGGKGRCLFCRKLVFAGGVRHKGNLYHKTCLGFSRMGLTPRQAGVENPKGKSKYPLGFSVFQVTLENGTSPKILAGSEYEARKIVNKLITLKIVKVRRLGYEWEVKKAGVENPLPGEIFFTGRQKKALSSMMKSAWSKLKGEPNPSREWHKQQLTDLQQRQSAARSRGMSRWDEGYFAGLIESEQNAVINHSNPRPPSGWWTRMLPRLRASYGYSPKRLSQIAAGIWYSYPEPTRQELLKRHDNPIGLCPGCGVTILNPMRLKSGRCPKCKNPLKVKERR